MTMIEVSRVDRIHPVTPFSDTHLVQVASRVTIKHDTTPAGIDRVGRFAAAHYKGTRSSGKTFSRWTTEKVLLLERRPDRPWILRLKSPRTGWLSAQVFAEGLGRLDQDLVSAAFQFGFDRPPSQEDFYPLLSHFTDPAFRASHPGPLHGLGSSDWAPSAFRRCFENTDNVQDLTRNIFGATRYRRDLVKAVASASLIDLVHAWDMRGLVPVDWTIEQLRRGSARNASPLPLIRPWVRTLDLPSLRNLVRDEPKRHFLRDTARFAWAERLDHNLGRIRSWAELHDQAVNFALAHQHLKDTKPKRPMRLDESTKVLEGTLVTPASLASESLVIEIARHEETLWRWGQTMRNCIGGYGRAMRSRHSILGGIHSDGTLLGNFEIRCSDHDRHLVQLLGFANKPLPDNVRQAVIDHFTSHDITIPAHYWGAPAPARVA